MQDMVKQTTVSVLKPKWTEDEVVKIVKNGHSWIGGLIPPRSFEILAAWDTYVPYTLTGVKYYKSFGPARRCYVFENLEKGLRSGVVGIENLEFVEEEAPVILESVEIDDEEHAADIAHYCNLELLVRNYRKFINWSIDILEVRIIYRRKRRVTYIANGKGRIKDIFLDGLVLK